jgi:hypothetical protein
MADTIFKIPKLKGSSNYDIWSIRVQAILVEKGYLEVIADNYIDKALDDTTQISNLEQTATKATALIKLALEDGPLLQTRFIENPFILWNTLRNLYEAKGFSSEFIISKELINTTLNSCKGNLEQYINNFKRAVNSLESKKIILPNKFLIALLLNNLNKDYDYVVAIITQTIRVDSTKDFKLDDIISQLLDESRRLSSIRNNKGYTSTTNYSNNAKGSNNPNSKSSNKNNNSSYANDIEMSMQTSYNKNRVNSYNKNNTSIKVCNYCKKQGHLEKVCYKKTADLKRKESVNNSNNLEDKTSNTKEESILISSSYNKVNKNNILTLY